jgi:hypothetical protein
MSKILFWAVDGALARRDPEWRLLDGALDALRTLSAEGWRHVAFAEAPVDLASLGLSDHVEPAPAAATTLTNAIDALRPFDQAVVIGCSLERHIMPAREASLASILVGDASPFAQFCVETPGEIPLALATWSSMRTSFLL